MREGNEMFYDIYTGHVNKINGYQIFVQDITPERIRLLIVFGCIGEHKEYSIGDDIVINKKAYQLTELFDYKVFPEKSPPGSGSGQLVARIERKNKR